VSLGISLLKPGSPSSLSGTRVDRTWSYVLYRCCHQGAASLCLRGPQPAHHMAGRFFEGFHEIFVSPPAWFVSLHFFTFFNLCLDELLFPDSSVSICQIGQDEGYLLFVVVVNQLVYFEVNISILHEQDKIASFPSKRFRWVKLDIFRGFRCCGRNSFRHCFFFAIGIGIGFVSWC
jgi:hypothetical protein